MLTEETIMSVEILFPSKVPDSALDDHQQGDRDTCGEWADRLVERICGDCRTRYYLAEEEGRK